MIFFLVAFATERALSLGFVLATWGASRLLGVPVKRAQLGMGPTPIKRDVGGVTLALGLIPIGSYVQFVAPEPPEGEPDDPEAPPPPDAYERASRPVRFAIAFAGLLGMALVPLIALGPVECAGSVARGIGQLARGTIDPLGAGRDLIAAAAALPLGRMPFVLAAKLLAWQLLPIPSTGLWSILRALLGFGWSKSCLAGLVPVAFGLVWLVALGAWLFTR